ncbi:mannosyl-oligosaccharide 1,2-alpha-mannosidase IB-like, partial [Limulus polyphemus]|uniref:alpha-1,2-Mannosidase n=1 Tax=Limulus polyphemus TaxID=6850 RepID=A0ABM1C2X1_LIMPO
MVSGAILPMYGRYLNGVPLTLSGRKKLRLREKFILFSVFGTFGVICMGSLYFLPEFRSGTGSTIHTAYEHIKDASHDFLLPSPPHDEVNNLNAVRHGHVNRVGLDPHRFEDRVKLNQKIQEDIDKEKNGNNIESEKVEKELPTNNHIVQVKIENKKQSEYKYAKNVDLNNRYNSESLPLKIKMEEGDKGNVINESHGREPTDPVMRERRNRIKEMMKHAWDNYVYYAFGQNELRPISRRGHSAGIFGKTAMGATIVDGLDTLFLMGLKEDYKKARDWIDEHLDFDHGVRGQHFEISVFETNIRFVGGLLSCYALTNDV